MKTIRSGRGVSLHAALLALLACLSGLSLAGCSDKPQPPPAAVKPAPTEPAPTASKSTADGEEFAVIETSAGRIVLRLYESEAPKTVAQFKQLARDNFYERTTFHRVLPGRLIQGGDPYSRDRDPYNDGTGAAAALVPAEFNKRPFKKGTVGLARGPNPDSGSCQFFICLVRTPVWDMQYTAFGEVVEGIEVAEEISKAQTNPKVARLVERPIRDQLIRTIRLERR